MLEIVFDESSAIALRQAQHYGEGPFRGPAAGVIGAIGDGASAAPAQAEAHRRMLEAEKRRWEQAVPLGGDPQDVLALPGPWDYGPLAGGYDTPARRTALTSLLDVWPQQDAAGQVAAQLARTAAALERVRQAAQAGTPLRVWTSALPNDACGLRWLMDILQHADSRSEISAVRLPRYDHRPEEREIVQYRGWFEMPPGAWGRFAPSAQVIPPLQRRVLADEWRRLEAESAPLRAVVNGQVVSVPDSFYDPFLLRALAAMPESFQGGAFIARMLVLYPCFGTDGLLWLRLQALIAAGVLEQVTSAPDDQPRYACLLRRTGR